MSAVVMDSCSHAWQRCARCAVGLAANGSLWDWVLSALAVLPLRMVGALRQERLDVGVVIRPPRESLAETRAAASRRLSETRIRRRLYYRYTLHMGPPDRGLVNDSPHSAHGSAARPVRGGRAGAWQTICAGGISRTRA